MRSYVGIDIGSESIKLVELKKTKNGIYLKKAGMTSFKEMPFYDGMSPDDLAAEAIKWLLSHNNLKKVTAVVSLPSSMVYSKHISLPVVPDEKIDQIIKFEARQQIPFPLEEVCWDYTVLGKSSNGEELNVVLHVVKEEFVASFMKNVTSAGIDVAIIDVMSMVLYNTMCLTGNNLGVILVDIGAKSTNVILMEKENCLTRNLPLGGDDLSAKIAKDLNISIDKAEILKNTVGLQGEGEDEKVSKALKEIILNLIKEIQRTIGFYRSKSTELIVKKVLLTGGNSKINGIIGFFIENLNLEVEVFDPFQWISISTDIGDDKIKQIKNHFTVAVGLALRGVETCPSQVNLIPKYILEEKYIAKNKIYLWFSALVLLLMFVVFNFFIIKNTNYYTHLLGKSSDTIAHYARMGSTIQIMEQDIKPLNNKLEMLKDIMDSRTEVLDILLAIRKVTLNEFWFDYFSIGISEKDLESVKEKTAEQRQNRYLSEDYGKRRGDDFDKNVLVLKGITADSYTKLDALRIALTGNPLFESINVINAEESIVDGRKKIKFDMKLVIAKRK